jgi:N-methylhydantoinase B/oxoprolinase/acetone carboxylase alpha subunit
MKNLIITTGIFVAAMFSAFDSHAGLDEKIAASFAAKYEVCALKLKDSNPLMAITLKAEADKVSRDKIGGGGYVKAFTKEKKKAWLLSKDKCRQFAKKISPNGFGNQNNGANFDTKVAASFAAKYEVCALKLKDSNPLIALKLKAKADEVSREKIGGGGYVEAYVKEKKKAWLLSNKKCKKLAKKI